jgi:hypothetical protein
MSASLTHPFLRIPLTSQEAIVAALGVAALVGNDNNAVVMARGVSGDFEDFTGLSLSDYPFEDLVSDDDWFSDYPEVELWVTVSAFAELAGGVL